MARLDSSLSLQGASGQGTFKENRIGPTWTRLGPSLSAIDVSHLGSALFMRSRDGGSSSAAIRGAAIPPHMLARSNSQCITCQKDMSTISSSNLRTISVDRVHKHFSEDHLTILQDSVPPDKGPDSLEGYRSEDPQVTIWSLSAWTPDLYGPCL